MRVRRVNEKERRSSFPNLFRYLSQSSSHDTCLHINIIIVINRVQVTYHIPCMQFHITMS